MTESMTESTEPEVCKAEGCDRPPRDGGRLCPDCYRETRARYEALAKDGDADNRGRVCAANGCGNIPRKRGEYCRTCQRKRDVCAADRCSHLPKKGAAYCRPCQRRREAEAAPPAP